MIPRGLTAMPLVYPRGGGGGGGGGSARLKLLVWIDCGHAVQPIPFLTYFRNGSKLPVRGAFGSRPLSGVLRSWPAPSWHSLFIAKRRHPLVVRNLWLFLSSAACE